MRKYEILRDQFKEEFKGLDFLKQTRKRESTLKQGLLFIII